MKCPVEDCDFTLTPMNILLHLQGHMSEDLGLALAKTLIAAKEDMIPKSMIRDLISKWQDNYAVHSDAIDDLKELLE